MEKVYRTEAKRILKNHREVSPTCALAFTEDAITKVLEEREKRGERTGRIKAMNLVALKKQFKAGLKMAVNISDKFCTCAAEIERDCYICQAAKEVQKEIKKNG